MSSEKVNVGVAKGHCRNAGEVDKAVQQFRKTRSRAAEYWRAAEILKICEAHGLEDRAAAWTVSPWGVNRIRREAANLAALREHARRTA